MPAVQISCIVPVRNGERFLAAAIESALGQTLPPVEIIVVDDGSTDRSAEIAAGFGAPVRVLRAPGQGPAAARNLGLAEARGDIISLLDCDDLWLPGKLAAQAAAIEAAGVPAISLVGVENFWMDEVAAERDQLAETRFAGVLAGYGPSALAASRAVFDRIGGFDPGRRHSDFIHWIMRAESAGVLRYLLPELLVQRRRHNANLTRVGSELARDEFLDLIREKIRLDRARAAAG